jgi:hypothetical protein
VVGRGDLDGGAEGDRRLDDVLVRRGIGRRRLVGLPTQSHLYPTTLPISSVAATIRSAARRLAAWKTFLALTLSKPATGTYDQTVAWFRLPGA